MQDFSGDGESFFLVSETIKSSSLDRDDGDGIFTLQRLLSETYMDKTHGVFWLPETLWTLSVNQNAYL